MTLLHFLEIFEVVFIVGPSCEHLSDSFFSGTFLNELA